ncbi:MAG: NAD-dependent deacylase [Candidatus Eisenbacteria bacterium]
MKAIETPILVLTGAGISRESGVPTFRGADGLWRNFRPEELATPEAFSQQPELVWEWYDWRRQAIAECRPNAAHDTIVAIEEWAPPGEFLLATQNVDGLHELAGSRNVRRLHGSIWHLRCVRCRFGELNRTSPLETIPPVCPKCAALLRPGVVWFGESLDQAVLGDAFAAAEAARTVLVIGTSSLVYPAAALPEIALRSGAHIIEVNPEETPLSPYVSERLEGPAAELLPAWWKERSRST